MLTPIASLADDFHSIVSRGPVAERGASYQPMTQYDHSDPTTIEQTTTIDAPRADLYAVLVDLETIPKYCPAMTVTPTEDGVEVTFVGSIAGIESHPSSPVTVRVAAMDEPARLTLALSGAIDGTVEWTLQPHDEHTRATVTLTYTVAMPTVQSATNEGDWTGVELQSAIVTTITTAVEQALTGLTQFCAQPSPPASMVTNVTTPEVYCPFPAEISPHLEDVTAHTQEWALEMGLIDEPSSKIATLSYFAGRMYPQAPPEALRLCNDWNCWGFLLDDATDPMGPDQMQHAQQPLLAILDGEASGPHHEPLVRALADIYQRASARMPPTWAERFAEHHRELFAGFRWEARNRETTTVPDYHAFIQNRQDFCGGKIVFDLMEMAMNSSPLPTEVYQRKAVRSLREAALNVTAWTNGVYSLRRELAADAIHNHVVIVRHKQGCSLQDAVTRTCELIEAETRRFEALSDRLTAVPDTEVDLQEYITGLEHALSGNLAWSKKSARYGDTE